LSREIATSLRGRSLTTEVFPFSFVEALAHRGVHAEPRPPRSARWNKTLFSQSGSF